MLKNPAQNNKLNSRSTRAHIDLQLWILAIRRCFSCSETGTDSFGMFGGRLPGVFCFKRRLRAFRGLTNWNSSSAAILFVLSAQALLCRSMWGKGKEGVGVGWEVCEMEQMGHTREWISTVEHFMHDENQTACQRVLITSTVTFQVLSVV